MQRLCFYTCQSVQGGWYPSMHCRFLSTEGSGIPACIAGLQAHTRGGGGSWGVWPGGSPGAQLGFGRSWGVWPGGGVSSPTTWGLVVGIPACTEASTPHPPPQQMAAAAGGTHPTGMHSCYYIFTPYQLLTHHWNCCVAWFTFNVRFRSRSMWTDLKGLWQVKRTVMPSIRNRHH